MVLINCSAVAVTGKFEHQVLNLPHCVTSGCYSFANAGPFSKHIQGIKVHFPSYQQFALCLHVDPKLRLLAKPKQAEMRAEITTHSLKEKWVWFFCMSMQFWIFINMLQVLLQFYMLILLMCFFYWSSESMFFGMQCFVWCLSTWAVIGREGRPDGHYCSDIKTKGLVCLLSLHRVFVVRGDYSVCWLATKPTHTLWHLRSEMAALAAISALIESGWVTFCSVSLYILYVYSVILNLLKMIVTQHVSSAAFCVHVCTHDFNQHLWK